MRRIYRCIATVSLEIMIHLWAVLSFLNFIGWSIRNRKSAGWNIMETSWYDSVIGTLVVFVPMAASVWFMYGLVTCDTIVL